jgi:hypothetical protein
MAIDHRPVPVAEIAYRGHSGGQLSRQGLIDDLIELLVVELVQLIESARTAVSA